MKKKFLFLTVLLAAVLVGCKKEKSELSLDEVKEQATLSGQVFYDAGVGVVNGAYTAEQWIPAVGKKVFVEIPLSEYKADATGLKVFEAIVDSTGNFNLEIPVLAKGIKDVTLRLEEFVQMKDTSYSRMEKDSVGKKPTFEGGMRRYHGEMSNLTLKPGPNYLDEPFKYEDEFVDMQEYKETAVITGKLRLPVETSFAIGTYKYAADCDLEIFIQDGLDLQSSDKALKNLVFNYGATTNKDGEFRLEVPVKSLKEGFQLNNIKIIPKKAEGFTHYKKNGSSVTLQGAYTLRKNDDANVNYYTVIDNIVADIDCYVGDLAMEFEPNYNNKIADEVKPAEWTRDLAGWVLGTYDLKDYTETVTVTGTIMLAKETSFGEGAYAAANKELVRLTINDYYDGTGANLTVEVPTNEKGEYSLQLPVKRADWQSNVSVANEMSYDKNWLTINYTHYLETGKTHIYHEGTYKLRETVQKAWDDVWYKVGTSYYVFALKDGETDDTYTDKLIGWHVAKTKDIYTSDKITGTVYLPKESSWAEGKYVKANNKRVKVTLEKDLEVVVLLKDGKFEFTIPVDKEHKQFSGIQVALMNEDAKELVFEHYRENKTTAKMEGKYELRLNKREEKARWNERGEFYYKFATEDIVEDYTDLLYGWYVSNDTCTSPAITGTIYLPKEKSLAVGEYVNAKNKRILVTLDKGLSTEAQVVVLVKDGKFDFTMPAETANQQFTVDVIMFEDDTKELAFVHYQEEDGAATKKEGKYELRKQVQAEDAKWNECGNFYYKFTTTEDIETWFNNIAGWVIPVVTENYEGSNTIGGTIMLSVEKSFGIGDYVPAKQRVIMITPDEIDLKENGKSVAFAVPTDDNGNFTFDLPAKQAGDELENIPAVEIKLSEEKKFTHYKNFEGAKCFLIGDYGKAEYLRVRDDKAQNNELGTYYYKFNYDATPGVNKESNTKSFSENLAGWVNIRKIGYPEEHDLTATGEVHMPYEVSFRNGAYKPFANSKVTLKVNGTTLMTVLTNDKGQFSLPIFRKRSTDKGSLEYAFDKKEIAVEDFVHYALDGTTEISDEWKGEYQLRRLYKTTEEAEDWTKLGTYYMKFKGEKTPEDWSDNLLGWVKIDLQGEKKKAVDFRFYIQKAIETTTTNDHKAGWADGDGSRKATVTVAGTQIDMYVSGSNINFSLPWTTELEEGTTKTKVTIALGNETENTTSFTHYEDKTKDESTTIKGNFVNGGNFVNKDVTYTTDKRFEDKMSAKLTFTPKSTPTGWSDYDWASILTEEVK